MKTSNLTSIRQLFLFSWICCVVFYSCQNRNNEKQFEEEITARLDYLTDSIIANTKVPGLAIGVWAPSKNLTYIRTKGFSDVTAQKGFSPEQAFRIGSNTKTFVGTIFLQLVDEGKITLDSKLNQYYPELPNANNITMKMLLNMSSGLPDYTKTDEFVNSIEQQPMRIWEPDELIALIYGKSAIFSPGEKFNYCNTNTIIIGRICEQLTGKPLKELIQTRISIPLKINNTFLAEGHNHIANGVKGNMTEGNQLIDVSSAYDISWAWAAGGMTSNLYEMKTWVEALVKGTLLSTNTHKQRFETMTTELGDVYGLAIYCPGYNMWGHTGGLPGYKSIALHHKDQDITLVIFYNYYDDILYYPAELAMKIMPLLLQ